MTNDAVLIAVAVIERGDRVLIGLRERGSSLAGYWEFPGGKVEAEESYEQAVVREVLEETGLRVVVQDELSSQDYRYEHGRVCLRFFACRVCDAQDSDAVLPDRFCWVSRAELGNYEFPPANAGLLAKLTSGV